MKLLRKSPLIRLSSALALEEQHGADRFNNSAQAQEAANEAMLTVTPPESGSPSPSSSPPSSTSFLECALSLTRQSSRGGVSPRGSLATTAAAVAGAGAASSTLSPHNFEVHTYSSPTWCYSCKKFLWGLINQGYRCTVCKTDVHKECRSASQTVGCPGHEISNPELLKNVFVLPCSPSVVEKFFLELDHIVKLREADKVPRKTLKKSLMKLLRSTITACGGQAGYLADLFHGYFRITKQVLTPPVMDQYIRLATEFLEDPDSSSNTSGGSSGSSTTSASTGSGESTEPLDKKKLLEGFLEFCKTHRIDPSNCLLGLTPSQNIITKHCENLVNPMPTFSKPSPPAPSHNPSAQLDKGTSRRYTMRNTNIRPNTLPTLTDRELTQMTKADFIKLIQGWGRINDPKALLSQVHNVARRLYEVGSVVSPGDLVIVRHGNNFLYARVASRLSDDLVLVRTSANERGAKSFKNQEFVPFPSSMEPMLGSTASAKRLVDNPVEKFLREVIEGMKDVVTNQLAKGGVDVDFLERVIMKEVVLSEKEKVITLKSKLQDDSVSSVEQVTAKLEELVNLGVGNFKANMDKSMLEHPLIEEALVSISTFQIKSAVTKRIGDYRAKAAEALDYLNSEQVSILSGKRKSQLADWWLVAIQERAGMFLEGYGYDFTAVPDDYITEAPKSLYLVQHNTAIVKRWIRPTNDEDRATLDQLIDSICGVIYPKLDLFTNNSIHILSTELSESGLTAEQLLDERTIQRLTQRIYSLKQNGASKEELKGLLQDCRYIQEMKKLEQVQRHSQTPGKLVMSSAVPISGLVMGCFLRLENELNTVLELHGKSSCISRIGIGPIP